MIGNSIRYYSDPDSVDNLEGMFAGESRESHAYNISTTDFVPSESKISYSYNALLSSDEVSYAGEVDVTPGKFGTPAYDDIYLSDGKGPRLLKSNVDNSFLLFAQLQSTDSNMSPMISDDGLTVYNIQWNINNLELNDESIVLVSGGTGYDPANTTVTISAPDDPYATGNAQATAVATVNTSTKIIESITITNPGWGYFKTPTVTISDANTTPGSGASVSVVGETSARGGNAAMKYFTKKVTLTEENESGDLRVFFSAYRPFGTNILVYYKIQNKNDTTEFDDNNWQLMTTIIGTNQFSKTRYDLIEFQCAPGVNGIADEMISYTNVNGITYTSFNKYNIKIVMSTDDNTKVPFVKELRTIALPPGTGF